MFVCLKNMAYFKEQTHIQKKKEEKEREREEKSILHCTLLN